MSTTYTDAYWPPFPVLEISLAIRDQTPSIGPFQALIDTGADGAFVPVKYIKQLKIPVSGQMIVHPHFGTPQVAHTHTLDILVGSFRFSAIEVVGDNQEKDLIVGRNLLNKLVLVLDGLRRQTDVWDYRPTRLPHA
jgi:predicted aspartyl protease